MVNCYNAGNIVHLQSEISPSYVGGVDGYSLAGNLYNCYNIGSVTNNDLSSDSYAGGIAGYADFINNSYNIGDISGNNIGGIAGTMGYNNKSEYNYYLDSTASSGLYNKNDDNVRMIAISIEQVNSGILKNLLNSRLKVVESTYMNFPLLKWQHNPNSYPTLVNTQNTNIEITNQKSGKVIVHHYRKGTGPKYGAPAVKLANDETIVGIEGEAYVTSPQSIPDHYLVKDENGENLIPDNATGTYKTEEQHVYYYYTRDPLNVTVHHRLEETKEPLADDETYSYEEGEHYKVTPNEKLLEKYDVSKVEGKTEGDITQNEEITYYYKLKEHQIITKVEIPAGRNEKGGSILGEGDEPYETVLHEENSKKDIIAKPEGGYRVKEIKLVSIDDEGNRKETVIYGNDSVKTAEISSRKYFDGSISVTKFIKMTEDKEVIVQFEPNEGKVIVHHYIEGTTEKIHEDQITKDIIGKQVETSPVENELYALVQEPEEKNVTIQDEIQEVTYYYQRQYKITTDVVEHDEKYKDGRIEKNIKGGSITDEDVNAHEYVIKNQNSKNTIEMIPNEGYEIVKVTINEEDYDFTQNIDETGKVTLPEEFFKDVQEDKHIEVEFRKKSKFIVKYLEEETEKVLYTTEDNMEYVEILGYEGKEFETEKKVIPYYEDSDLGITDENKNKIEPNGTMFADEITVIYWYKKIESGVVERHIEINEKGETKEIEKQLIEGYVSEEAVTNRKTYENYIPVDGPENEDPNITVVGKDETSKTVIFEENNVLEVWYYYERVFKITTEVKSHKEKIDDQEVTVDGGTISKEFIEDSNGEKIEVTFEEVLCRGNSTKEVIMKPDEKYRIKSITINDVEISIESLEKLEDGSVKIPVGYFDDMQEDKHIVVEFVRIPAKVIVQYKDIDTKESIKEDKVVEGFIDTKYNAPRVEIDSYIPAGEEPTNSEGTMTEETIIVTYWYTKQFKITTDVKGHSEPNNESVKGGEISGEDEMPYEIVTRGESSQKEIIMKPENGYRIKSLTINEAQMEITSLLKEDGTITLPKFENMQEDKHIVVEFERKPGKVIVKYVDKETQEEIADQKIIDGYVNDPYSEERIDIEGYIASGDDPENKSGKMIDGEIVVVFYYEKEPEVIPENKEPEKQPEENEVEIIEPQDNFIPPQDNFTPPEFKPEQFILEEPVDENISYNIETQSESSDIKDVKTGDSIIAFIITLVSSIVVFIKSFKHKK